MKLVDNYLIGEIDKAMSTVFNETFLHFDLSLLKRSQKVIDNIFIKILILYC